MCQTLKQTAQAADQSDINQCGLKILVVTSTHPEPKAFFRIWHKKMHQLVEPFLREWKNGSCLFDTFMFKTDWLSHINMIQFNISLTVTREACVPVNVCVEPSRCAEQKRLFLKQTFRHMPSTGVWVGRAAVEHTLSCLALFVCYFLNASRQLKLDTWQQTTSK